VCIFAMEVPFGEFGL